MTGSRTALGPAAGHAPPTVFVVDDDDDLRQSLGWLFEAEGLRVRGYATAAEFLAEYDAATPGCLVLDVLLPGLSGLDLQDELARRGGAPPTIVISGRAKVPMAVRALKAGATDFVQKPFGDREILECVRRAIELDRRVREEHAAKAGFEGRLALLTPRERQVLELVVAGKPNKIIASDLGISSKTVEIHRGRVMEKTRAGSVAELVRLVMSSKEPPPRV